MTLTFFISILLVLLFGRRAVCSWNCPCVGTRDTMGAAFRKETIKSEKAWRFRHLKWVLTSFNFVLFVVVLLPFPKAKWLADVFFGVVGVIYFTSFLFIPLTGNRNWCRWLCPYGQTFGVLNKAGFYKIKADKEQCISCGKCTKECDMGIPVQTLVETKGQVNTMDCVGCGRCVTNCPQDVLRFSDIRDSFKKIQPRKKPLIPEHIEHEGKKDHTASTIGSQYPPPKASKPFQEINKNSVDFLVQNDIEILDQVQKECELTIKKQGAL